MDLKRVSEWLGHSDIDTTANIYVHLTFKDKIEISDKMEALLRKEEGDDVHSEEKC